jgi:sugar-specific transcriptional regulator TrmB
MKPDIIATLQDLGFTEYEAKAYLALLEKSPLTGYAVALNSSVPRSKIYEVLGGLAERGEVIVSHGSPALYSPLPPQELIKQRREKADSTLVSAADALEHYTSNAGSRENIWSITGREEIFSRVKEVIAGATGRLMFEIWLEDFFEIEQEIKAAAARGVEILVVSYGKLVCDFAKVYNHDLHEEITRDYGGRWVIVSADDREIVAGIVSLGDASRAAWTMHPGLVMPITEIILHDIYIMEIMDAHRDVLEATFGPNLTGLRNKYKFGPAGVSVASRFGLV